MKRTLAPIAALALLVLAGCAATPGEGEPVPLPQPIENADLRGEWTLVGVIQGDIDLSFSDIPVTMEFTNGNARVRTGCFSFDQPMASDLDFVTTGYSQPTASCLGFSDEQTQAIESLAGVVKAKRDGDVLRLMSQTSVLRFELVPAVPKDALLGTYQLSLVTYGDVGATPQGSPTITFAADGKVTGTTVCNQFEGELGDPVSGTNTMTVLTMTQVGCEDNVEADITAVLQGGFLIHVSDGSVSLVSSTSETTLVYDPVS